MGIFDWVKSLFTPPPPPKETVTTTELPPVKPDPIRSIDYTDTSGDRTGGITISGTDVWTSGGGSAPAPVTIIATDFPEAETQKKVESLGFQTVKQLQPADAPPITQDYSVRPKAIMSEADPDRLAERPYSLGDEMTGWSKFKTRFTKYKDPIFWRTVISTPFAGGMGTKYATVDYPNILASLSLLYPTLPERYRKRKGDVPSPEFDQFSLDPKFYDPTTKTYATIDIKGKRKDWKIIREQEIVAKGAEKRIQVGVEKDILPRYIKQFEAQSEYYQSKIDTGELGLEKAEELFGLSTETIQKQYGIEAGELFQKRLKSDPTYKLFRGWEQKYGEAIQFKSDIGSSIFTTGVLVGGSFVAPVTVGAVIAQSGISSGYKAISEKEYTKAGISFAVAGLGIYGSMRTVASQLTKLKIEEVLATKPKVSYSMRIQSKGLYTDFYRSAYSTPKAYAYTQGSVVSKLGRGRTFKILGGRSDTIVLTRDVWTGKPLIVGGGQKILTSGGRFYPSFKGFVPSKFGLVTSQKFQYSAYVNKFGLAKMRIKHYTGFKRITSTDYGGISKTFKDRILSFSGRSKDYAQVFKVKGVKGISEKGYTFDVETIGLTKIIDITKFTKGISFKPFDYSRLKVISSQTGVSSIQILQPPVIASIPSATQIYGSTSGIISKISGVSSAILTTQKQDPILLQQKKISQALIQPTKLMQKQITKQEVISIPSFATRVIPSQAIIPAQAQIPKIMQQQRMVQVPKFALPISTPTTPFSVTFPFKAGLPPFIPRLPRGMKEAGVGKRRIKVKRIVKYTPSFSAIVLGIRGKKPKGIETGLRIRPITKATEDLFAFYRRYIPRKRIIKKKKVKRR